MWDLIIWNDNTVDFVPSTWSNDNCSKYKYPKGLSEPKIRKLIYDCEDIKTNFEWCVAKLKKRGITCLKTAKILCSQAEETSNIDDVSDDDVDLGKRKRKRPARLIEEEEKRKKQSESETDDSDNSNQNAESVQFRVPSPVLEVEKSGSNMSDIISSCSTLTCSGISCDSHKLGGLTFELKELNRKVDRLENLLLSQQKEKAPVVLNTFITNLPSATSEELQRVCDEISSSEAKRQQMINMLSLLGGSTVRKAVFLIMGKIFDKNLALEYSGEGKKKKKAFSDMPLYEIVIEATRVRHPSATNEDIKKNISLFLASAKQRLPKN